MVFSVGPHVGQYRRAAKNGLLAELTNKLLVFSLERRKSGLDLIPSPCVHLTLFLTLPQTIKSLSDQILAVMQLPPQCRHVFHSET
jgi:hypothetical protein